jgi:uncharacterized membrane protein YdbT with pleckstrin-like domain
MPLRESLLTGEQIAFESEKHWIAPFRASVVPILLLVAAYFIGVISPSGGGIIGAVGSLLDLVKIGLVVFGVGSIVYNLVVWRTAKFVVTNLRVIREEGLVSRRESATLIDSVTDVKSRVPFLGARLGYGDLIILTQSGEAGQDTFQSITRPVAFRNEIMSRKTGAGRTAAAAPAAVQATAAPPAAPAPLPAPPTAADHLATIEQLADLRDRGAITPEEFEAKKADLLGRI